MIVEFKNLDLLERVANNVEPAIEKALLEAAKYIQQQARIHVPVDTGATRASIYISTQKYSDYAEASAQASALRPFLTVFPEVKSTQSGMAVVAVGTDYSPFLEFGTSRMAARPFFYSAVHDSRSFFRSRLAYHLRQL